ncbi:MAG: hypothetical protein AAF802_02885 [Planctomycetota bacterium]
MLPPCPVFVLDICQVSDEYRLIELNPFGGADLYGCDSNAIVQAVSEFAMNSNERQILSGEDSTMAVIESS